MVIYSTSFCVCLEAEKIRKIFGIGLLELGSWHLDVENGKCLLLRWFCFLNHSSFLCVCLATQKITENFGDWNVGARVLGYLDEENGKVYFSEVDVVIWPEKTHFLFMCLFVSQENEVNFWWLDCWSLGF